MNSSSDSDGEGFFKPTIQISNPTQPIHTEIINIED